MLNTKEPHASAIPEPGVTADSPQDPLTPGSVLPASPPLSRGQVVAFQRSHLEGRIRFILNRCSTEQQSEATACISLFPKGRPPLAVKYSEGAAS